MPEVDGVVNEPPPPVVDPAGRNRQADPPVWSPPSGPPSQPVQPAAAPPPRPAPQPPVDAGPILPMPGSLHESLGDSVDSSTRALVLDLSGEEICLDRRLVLGREPRLATVAPHGVNPNLEAKAVPVDDFTLSRTHCWIEPSREGALICDLQLR